MQNIAGPKPLLITELGLDSRAHGEEAQAAFFREQLPVAFAAGVAGATPMQGQRDSSAGPACWAVAATCCSPCSAP